MRDHAILVTGIDTWQTIDRPVPQPAEGEAVVRVALTGLCRTDLKLIRSGHRDLVLPRVPGEEVVGTVLNHSGAGPAPGTRVWVYPGAWCGSCPACQSGAENLCRSMRIMGFHRDGGFARFVTVPSKSLVALPDGLPDEAAVLAEPLSCCLNALDLARLSSGERLTVWGAGTAGTLIARAARARGATVAVVEPDAARRQRALGHDQPPEQPADVAVVAVGDVAAYHAALGHLAPRGRLVVFSGLAPAAAAQPIDLNRLHYLEQTLIGAYGCAPRHGPEALALIASGAVPVRDLVTHRLPLWNLATGLDLVANRAGMKVLLDPWSPLP